MGSFNEILAGRFNRFAQKHFSMKGREGAPTLAADVQLGMQFSSGYENRYLEGWDLYGNFLAIAATAAQLSQGMLRNPPGSGVVGVVTNIIWVEASVTTVPLGVTLQFTRGPQTTDQQVAGTAIGWDSRSRPQSTLLSSKNNAAFSLTSPTTIGGYAAPANTQINIMPPGLEIILLPGEAIMVQGGNVNTATNCTFWWRERALEDSEKA